jgi:hypothetical protein
MSCPSQTGFLRRIARALALGAIVVATPGCVPGIGVYGGGYDGDYPPDSYIGTTEPIFFDGRANYWYGGRWNYREGGRWNRYDREPAALNQRRMQGLPARRNFERSGGGAPGRFSGHSGGGRGRR